MKYMLLSLALLLSAPLIAMDFPGASASDVFTREKDEEKENKSQINPNQDQPEHRCPLHQPHLPPSNFGSLPFERSTVFLRPGDNLASLPALNKILEQVAESNKHDGLLTLMDNADLISKSLRNASPFIFAWLKAPKAEHDFKTLESCTDELNQHTNDQDILLKKVNKEDFGQTQAFKRLLLWLIHFLPQQ